MTESHELARILLEKAKGDQYVAERLVDDMDAPTWTFGFHAQQAVEKALKAVLSAHTVDYPRTHNLAMLLELLRQKDLTEPPDADDLPSLTPFGTVSRYEDEDTGVVGGRPRAGRGIPDPLHCGRGNDGAGECGTARRAGERRVERTCHQ